MPYPDFVEIAPKSTPEMICNQLKHRVTDYNKTNTPLDFVIRMSFLGMGNKPNQALNKPAFSCKNFTYQAT